MLSSYLIKCLNLPFPFRFISLSAKRFLRSAFDIADYLKSSLFALALTILSRGAVWGGRVVRWCCVNFQCQGVLLIWIIEGQGHSVLAVGAGGDCLVIFLFSVISLCFLPLFGRS